MKVEVMLERADIHSFWIVCSPDISVRFNNEAAANTYAQRLESRLNAPHTWPGRHAHGSAPNPLLAREMQPRAV